MIGAYHPKNGHGPTPSRAGKPLRQMIARAGLDADWCVDIDRGGDVDLGLDIERAWALAYSERSP
ncbi:hypothetical protein Axi01nite_87540 [Actinoplanes xinjiangensis]|nr:hypothetical protein Axi01nite_87540 [Actinoplanes xinjiangensis]